jgi:hypothetical protein
LTSVLDGGEWSASRFGRSTLRKRASGTHRRPGGPQSRFGRGEEKHSQPPSGIEPYYPSGFITIELVIPEYEQNLLNMRKLVPVDTELWYHGSVSVISGIRYVKGEDKIILNKIIV